MLYNPPPSNYGIPYHTDFQSIFHNQYISYASYSIKNTPVSELVEMGENQMGLENLARLRKQDIIFAILKQHAKSGEDILAKAY
ncbi:transcription termination factor Rho [Actinobacillus equuli]|nr:transcription termination factor Rho [Actinobacillus equuli]